MTNNVSIFSDEVISALNEVKNIQDILKLNYLSHDYKNKSDADLLDICRDYLGKEIVTAKLKNEFKGGAIRAFVVTYNDRYEICLLSGLNYCYAKFSLCKELIHIVIENPEFGSKSTDFDETVSNCVNGGLLLGASSNEYVAEIAAMEYLFPYKDRLNIVKNNSYDFDNIADTYKIPRLLVEKYLDVKIMENLLNEGYARSNYAKEDWLS